MNELAECRSCRKPIRWTLSATTGAKMPLDRDPDPTGNVWLVFDPHGLETVGVICQLAGGPAPRLDDPRPPEGPYRSHFASCPDAEAWRR